MQQLSLPGISITLSLIKYTRFINETALTPCIQILSKCLHGFSHTAEHEKYSLWGTIHYSLLVNCKAESNTLRKYVHFVSCVCWKCPFPRLGPTKSLVKIDITISMEAESHPDHCGARQIQARYKAFKGSKLKPAPSAQLFLEEMHLGVTSVCLHSHGICNHPFSSNPGLSLR